MATSLISLAELDDSAVEGITAQALGFARDASRASEILRGKVVGLLFAVSSTRTRTAFWRAALDMSAKVMVFGPGELQLSTGETYADTGRILSNVTDALVVRTNADQAEMYELAQGHPAVINAMSMQEHPTQAIGDYVTIAEHFGNIEGLRLSYFGEGNNTAAALVLLFSTVPRAQIRLYVPERYSIDAAVLGFAQRRAKRFGATVTCEHRVPETMPLADVIYTTRWQTMGVGHADPNWRDDFLPFRVDGALFERCADTRAIFMHDLPAVRGDEVTQDVLDGPRSLAWRQSWHKLTGAKAALAWSQQER